MKLNCVILLLAFQLSACPIFSQTSTVHKIIFHPEFNHSPIHLDSTFYKLDTGDSIRFDKLKFYISGIVLLKNQHPVWKEESSFHLVDAADDKSMQVILRTPSTISYDQVKFNLGIDSVTNVSGAMGGDLDPTKAMYWTWQNGYINFKLEGSSNLCKTRNNEFQFHLGGYQFPNNAIQTIALMTSPEEITDINIELKKFIGGCDFKNSSNIMSPSKEAVILSKMAASAFSIREK